VKVSNPEMQSLPWWPSTYEAAEAIPAIRKDRRHHRGTSPRHVYTVDVGTWEVSDERDLEKKMVLLSGPRQVGNSYLARSIIEAAFARCSTRTMTTP
jgi:hypothetical protein